MRTDLLGETPGPSSEVSSKTDDNQKMKLTTFFECLVTLPVSILARLDVIPNVLSNVHHDRHNELNNAEDTYCILQEAAHAPLPDRLLHSAGPRIFRYADPPKKCGKAFVSSDLVLQLKEKAGILPLNVENVEIQTTVVTATTSTHTDHFAGNVPVPSVESVAFVSLSTNKDAYFDADSTCIPFVRGNLVSFPGHVAHHTVVNAGTVDLLGPFHLTTMQDVKMVEPLLSGIVLGLLRLGLYFLSFLRRPRPRGLRLLNSDTLDPSTDQLVSLMSGGLSLCGDETDCLDDEGCADLYGNGCQENSGMCVRYLEVDGVDNSAADQGISLDQVSVVFDACVSTNARDEDAGTNLKTFDSRQVNLEELDEATVETYYHSFHVSNRLMRPNPNKIESLAIHRWLQTGEQPWHQSTLEHYKLIVEAMYSFGNREWFGSSPSPWSVPRVLDAGCGFGAGLMWLEQTQPDWQLVGYTLSVEEKDFIDQELSSYKFETSLRSYDNVEGKFDVIYSIESFFHSPDHLNTLQIWGEALHPGGLLVLLDDFPEPTFDTSGEAETMLLTSWHLEAPADLSGHLQGLPDLTDRLNLILVEDRNLGEEYNIIENNYGNVSLPMDVLRTAKEPWLKGSLARYHLTVGKKLTYRLLVFKKSSGEIRAHCSGAVWAISGFVWMLLMIYSS